MSIKKTRWALSRLVKARDPRLASTPRETVRDHCNGRKRPSSAFQLALYVRLGIPLEGWLTAAERRELDKVAPWPVPDYVYEVADPLDVMGGGQ